MSKDVDNTIDALGASLSEALNKDQARRDRFTVVPRFNTMAGEVKGVKIQDPPNFVVTDAETSKVVFIDVKGSEPSRSLPLGSYSGLVEQAREYESLEVHPRVIIVSVSGVPDQMKLALVSSGISVVEAPSTADVVGEVAKGITATGPLFLPD